MTSLAGSRAFVDFLHRMPFYGTAVLCVDSPAVREILPHVTCPVTSYGFSEDAQVRAVNARAGRANALHGAAAQRRHAARPGHRAQPGGRAQRAQRLVGHRHCGGAEHPDAAVQRALAGFKGVGRRFQSYGNLPAKDGGQFTVIDDYGHHPVEMAATLAAARGAFLGAPGAGLPAPPLQPHAIALKIS